MNPLWYGTKTDHRRNPVASQRENPALRRGAHPGHPERHLEGQDEQALVDPVTVLPLPPETEASEWRPPRLLGPGSNTHVHWSVLVTLMSVAPA